VPSSSLARIVAPNLRDPDHGSDRKALVDVSFSVTLTPWRPLR
jgi:hypothetical protein